MEYFLLPALGIFLAACDGSKSVQLVNIEADTIVMGVFKTGDFEHWFFPSLQDNP